MYIQQDVGRANLADVVRKAAQPFETNDVCFWLTQRDHAASGAPIRVYQQIPVELKAVNPNFREVKWLVQLGLVERDVDAMRATAARLTEVALTRLKRARDGREDFSSMDVPGTHEEAAAMPSRPSLSKWDGLGCLVAYVAIFVVPLTAWTLYKGGDLWTEAKAAGLTLGVFAVIAWARTMNERLEVLEDRIDLLQHTADAIFSSARQVEQNVETLAARAEVS